MKVAVVSHDIAWRDIEENVITVADLLNRVDRDCDIVVLPELFTTGNILSKEEVSDLAEDETGIAIVNVQRWSQFFGFAICGTFLAKDNGKFYNRAFFAEPFGDITYYDNLDDFFSKNKDGNFFFFTTKARQTHSDVTYTDKSFLFFGKETKGLPEELLLEHPNECVRIPMIDDARSLNLSNSVAIGVYEALRQLGYPELSNKGELHNYKWE